MGVGVEVVVSAYTLMVPFASGPLIVPDGFAKPLAYELPDLWSRCPVPVFKASFRVGVGI